MKRILCYGDSNTWGNSAFSQERIPFEKQWVNLLAQLLGSNSTVIQEGLLGRVAGNLQTSEAWYNGRDVFRALFISHSPLDIVIIALGTNDFQTRYGRTAEQIAHDILWYVDEIKHLSSPCQPPRIILLAPVRFRSTTDYFEANAQMYDAVMKLLRPSAYVYFMQDTELSEDGVHFTYAGHERYASELAKLL